MGTTNSSPDSNSNPPPPSSRRRSTSTGGEQQQQQQTLEQLKSDCVDLDIDFPSNATREELLELLTAHKTKRKSSFWKIATDSYEELVKAIIRPPRAQYSIQSLGRNIFYVDGISHERHDIVLVNERGLKLQCSWWRPRENSGVKSLTAPCVVYLHGNSSCRAEALEALPSVLGSRMTLFAFDFSGSGLSDGEYVSLGYYEREDLSVVIRYLRESSRVSTIGLWGRSMGAVTALLFVDRDPSISCVICDSPFASLRTLARELVESTQINVPKFAVGLGLRMVRSSVKSRANFDINILEPITNVSKCFVPALFAAGEEDTFIHPRHAQQIHDAYAGDKNIVLFKGDHNSSRPEYFLDSCIIFMHNAMIHDGTITSPSHHETNLGAAEFHMPSPLANNHLHHEQHFFEDTPRQQSPREEDDDDEAAFQDLLQQALLISMNDTKKSQNNN